MLSLDVAYILIKDIKPFTVAEGTIKKCLIKPAERLQDKAVDRFEKNSTVCHHNG